MYYTSAAPPAFGAKTYKVKKHRQPLVSLGQEFEMMRDIDVFTSTGFPDLALANVNILCGEAALKTLLSLCFKRF